MAQSPVERRLHHPVTTLCGRDFAPLLRSPLERAIERWAPRLARVARNVIILLVVIILYTQGALWLT